jgi:hypothetical protein
MAVRILLLAAAVALVVAGVARGHQHSACQDARFDALSVGLHKRPVTDAPSIASAIERHCRDVDEWVNGAVVLSRVGAADLAHAAVEREPDRRNSWLALATVRQRVGDASGAARARARAVVLDPVGLRGSLNRSSGRSTR